MRHLVGILFLLLAVLGWAQGESPLATAPNRRIEPGDRFRVECADPTLAREYSVESQGRLEFGVIDGVTVAGLSVADAKARITERIRAALAVGEAEISVHLLRRDDLPVRFSGAVANPGSTLATEDMRLRDALAMARPQDGADPVLVLVDQMGEKRLLDTSLATNLDMRLEPGDHLHFAITQRVREVFVLGAVTAPGAYPFANAMTLADAVAAAGGLTSLADRGSLEVLRANAVVLKPGSLDTEALAFRLVAGDVVRVSVKKERYFIGVDGAVRHPSILDFDEGMTLLKAVNAVGGPADQADLSRVQILRLEGGRQVRTTHDLLAISRGLKADVPLKPGDAVFVPTGKGAKSVPANVDLLIRRLTRFGGRG